MRYFRQQRLKTGFTIIELIVVIVILGILALIAIPTFNSVIDRTKDERSLRELEASGREMLTLLALDEKVSLTTGSVPVLEAVLQAGQKDSVSYASGGIYAAEGQLSSVAWKNVDEPTALTPDVLWGEVDALSNKYSYFSLGFSSGSTPILGMAMQSLNPDNCVFATFDASSSTLQETIISKWASEGEGACKGSNAAWVIENPNADIPENPDAPDDGTPGGVDAAPDTAETVKGFPVTVDVIENDNVGTEVVSISPASNGDVTFDGEYATFMPHENYTGTETFGYTSDAGASSTVTITVEEFECTEITNLVLPLGYDSDDGCASGSPPESHLPDAPDSTPATPGGSTPSSPENPTGPVAIASLTSYPHSDLRYPHWIYATTTSGGIIWAEDKGPTGCLTPGDLTGGNCRNGWLHPAGTFDTPTAAVTGQGPDHGIIPARFSFDTMFVADKAGIWASRVDAFERGTVPELLVPASSMSGTVTSLTGYQCYTEGVLTEGNCLWYASNNGSSSWVGQINVNTGAITEYSLGTRAGALSGLTMVQNGDKVELIGTTKDGWVSHISTTGTGPSFVAPPTAAQVSAVLNGDIYLDHAGTIKKTMGIPTTFRYSSDVVIERVFKERVTAFHTHGVPNQIYYATDTQCIRKIDNGSLYTLWCTDGHVPVAPMSDSGWASGGMNTFPITMDNGQIAQMRADVISAPKSGVSGSVQMVFTLVNGPTVCTDSQDNRARIIGMMWSPSGSGSSLFTHVGCDRWNRLTTQYTWDHAPRTTDRIEIRPANTPSTHPAITWYPEGHPYRAALGK